MELEAAGTPQEVTTRSLGGRCALLRTGRKERGGRPGLPVGAIFLSTEERRPQSAERHENERGQPG